MCDVAEGDQAVVRRVPDSDAELLRYLASLGLMPERELIVVEQAPFDGPVTVEVDGERHAIGRSVAARIEVAAL